MTTNSPNPVDGDVQALIADCQAEIEDLKRSIDRCDAIGTSDYLYQLQSKLKRQYAALASLTAEPVIYAIQNEDERENGYMTEFSSSGIAGYVNPEKYGLTGLALYTTPPAQLLRPVELPDCEFGAVSHMSGGSKDYCNGFVDGTNNAIKAMREAGYEVKS